VQRQQQGKRQDGDRELLPAYFREREPVPAGRDRTERHARSRGGEAFPLRAESAAALRVDRHRADQTQQQQGAEQHERGGVAVHREVHGRPQRRAPEKGMAGHPDDALHGIRAFQSRLESGGRRVRRQQSRHGEQETHEDDGHGHRAQRVRRRP